MTSNSVQTIRETAELLNLQELEKAVDILNQARRIHFFGIGASGIIALDGQQKFVRIDKTAYAFTDVHEGESPSKSGISGLRVKKAGESPSKSGISGL